MAADIYLTGLAAGLVKMGRFVEDFNLKKGRLVYHSAGGFVATITAKMVDNKLKITERRVSV